MSRLRILLLAAAVLGLASDGATQQRPKPAPKLEPVAETRLLMEGLNAANFKGAERLLKDKPADVETWTFVRGQALLIAETGNLLMLRPPKNEGEGAWMDRSAGLREAAAGLARSAAARDYDKSRAGLVAVAGACNRCHTTFRVPVTVGPFAEKEGREGKGTAPPAPRPARQLDKAGARD